MVQFEDFDQGGRFHAVGIDITAIIFAVTARPQAAEISAEGLVKRFAFAHGPCCRAGFGPLSHIRDFFLEGFDGETKTQVELLVAKFEQGDAAYDQVRQERHQFAAFVAPEHL